MVIKMAKRSHTDKVHTLGQLQALYKTVISLQKEIKKLDKYKIIPVNLCDIDKIEVICGL